MLSVISSTRRTGVAHQEGTDLGDLLVPGTKHHPVSTSPQEVAVHGVLDIGTDAPVEVLGGVDHTV